MNERVVNSKHSRICPSLVGNISAVRSRWLGVEHVWAIHWEDAMARDTGLEELISDELRSVPDITEKSMFGGQAWLLGGNFLCGARDDGMLVRLGKGQDAWALQIPGVVPMLSRGRHMQGWVRASGSVYGEDALRKRLIICAIDFVHALPRK